MVYKPSGISNRKRMILPCFPQMSYLHFRFQGLATHNIPFIMSVVFGTVSWMGFMLVVCNFGENVSNAYEALHPAIYDVPWHYCPVDFQKWVVLMLRASQEQTYIRGFFSITCSREMYKQVNCIIILRSDFISYLVGSMSNICGIWLSRFLRWHAFSIQIINTGFSYFMIFRRFY